MQTLPELDLAACAGQVLVVGFPSEGPPAELRALVYLLSAAQLLIHMNATLSALLHAKGEVSAMSALSFSVSGVAR